MSSFSVVLGDVVSQVPLDRGFNLNPSGTSVVLTVNQNKRSSWHEIIFFVSVHSTHFVEE